MLDTVNTDSIVDSILSSFSAEMILSSLNDPRVNDKMVKYQPNPVGFCEDEFGEEYTDDVKVMMESVRDNVITIAKSANATGKSQPIDTLIKTPAGDLPIGKLNVGDFVFGQNGKPTKVMGVFPQGFQPTYKISFNDHTSTQCSEDHLWNVRSSCQKGRGKGYITLTTKELIPIVHRYLHIPMCSPVEFEPKVLLIDPYVMGFLIGDGTLGQFVRFDSPDQFIINEIDLRTPGIEIKHYRETHYGATTPPGKKNPLLDTLREEGLIGKKSNEKFIPQSYLAGSVAQRKLLLAGLMDSDGYIDKRHSFSYSTTSQNLVQNFKELVWSLGGTAKAFSKYPTFTHKGEKRTGQKAYTIHIKLPFCPFQLPRKKARYIPEEELQKQAQRVIKTIEYIGRKESVCIQVEHESGLYLTENYIVTHNTHAAARVALWFYKCHPGAQVYTAAAPPKDNLETLLWGEIGSLISKHPHIVAGDTCKNLSIKRSPLEFVKGVAIPSSGTSKEREAKFSGKHAPYMLFIFDEGDAIPDEVYAGTESCMTGGHVRLLIMFNPRAATGTPHRMEIDKVANIVPLTAFTHPNVISGETVLRGAVSREVTVRRINEWCRPLMDDETYSEYSCFTLPDFLVGAIACRTSDNSPYEPLLAGIYKIVQPAFSYMVLGRYPAQSETQLISEEWVSRARLRYDQYVAQFGEVPPVGARGIMGVDVAEFGLDKNTCARRYGGFIPPLKKWEGVDPTVTARKSSAYYLECGDIQYANIDGTGVGAGVAQGMKDQDSRIAAHSVKVASSPTEKSELGDFGILRDQLYWSYREWLRTDDTAMLPPDKDLILQTLTPTYSTDDGKVRIMRKPDMKKLLQCSPDEMESVILTFAPTGFFGGVL